MFLTRSLPWITCMCKISRYKIQVSVFSWFRKAKRIILDFYHTNVVEISGDKLKSLAGYYYTPNKYNNWLYKLQIWKLWRASVKRRTRWFRIFSPLPFLLCRIIFSLNQKFSSLLSLGWLLICRRMQLAFRIADRSVNGVILSGQIRRTAAPLETARRLMSCSWVIAYLG